MRSIGKIAVRCSIGLILASGMALPPEPVLAKPQSVFSKLERLLTGQRPKARSPNRKARPGRKSRRQASPNAEVRPSTPKSGRQRKQGQTDPEAKTRQNPSAAAGRSLAPSPVAPSLPAIVAVPAVKPADARDGNVTNPAPSSEALPSPPVPSPNPRAQAETAAPVPEKQGPIAPGPVESGKPSPPAADETACRAQLAALGVEFAERPPESDLGVGCSIPHPVFVTRLSKTVTLQPGGLLNCAMTEAAARFIRDVVQAVARKEIGSELTGIGQASAYVCRTRHGRSKISEHAFGNALDISRFSFADGTTADVGPAPGEKQGRFLAAVRAAACGPFKTVLGPGSDPDHATHFHLDLEQRRHGGTFCK